MKIRDWKTGGGYIRGVDVSSYQGAINYAKLKENGIKFAILRAYGSAHQTGGDSRMLEYANGFKSVGIPCGSYFFCTISNEYDMASARNQANMYADKLEQVFGAGSWGQLTPFLDLENNENVGGRHASLNTTGMINWVNEFRNTFQARFQNRVKLGIYTSWYFIKDHNNFNNGALKDMPLWMAKWRTTSIPDVGGWTDWVLWQYTDNAYPFTNGQQAGVSSTGLDMNYCESLDDLTFNQPIETSTPIARLEQNNVISVQWKKATLASITKIELYRNEQLLATLDKNAEKYIDLATEYGRNYSYHLIVYTAYDKKRSPTSNTIQTIVPMPSVPTGLTVYPRDKGLLVSWNPNPYDDDITGYSLFMNGTLWGRLQQTGVTILDLTNGTNYSFQVQAHNRNPNPSPLSPAVIGTPVRDFPNAPKKLETNINANKDITLTWIHVPKTNFSHFEVHVDGTLVADNITTTSYIFSGLALNVAHTFKVVSVDTDGDKTESVTKSKTYHQPKQVKGLRATPLDRRIDLVWDDVMFDIPNEPVVEEPPIPEGEPAVTEPSMEELVVPVPEVEEPPNPSPEEIQKFLEPEPEIIIPPPQTPPPQPAGTIVYTIKEGDTLFHLAQYFETTTAKLLELNPTLNPEHLLIGQEIYTTPKPAPQPRYQLLTYEQLKENALALTALMETSTGYPHCYGVTAGNFDGAGMSFGAIQFNIKSDSLQPILRTMFNTYRTITKNAWNYANDPTPFNNMDYYVNRASKSAFLSWANSISSSSNKHKLKEPYATYMKNMGVTKECIALQVAGAESYFTQAKKYFDKFGLWSRRGFALMFDIAVQSWSISSTVESQIWSDFSRISTAGKTDAQIETEKMRIITERRGNAVSSTWRNVWKTRKYSISNGSGVVYGSLHVDTNKYNMILEPAFSYRVPPQFQVATANIEADDVITENKEEVTQLTGEQEELRDVYLDRYLIFEGEKLIDVVDGTVTSYTVTGLENNKEYSFTIEAVSNQDIRGGKSAPIIVKPIIDFPNKATNLRAEVVDRHSILFSWEHEPTANFSHFDIKINGTEVLVNTTVLEYRYDGAVDNTDYTLEIISYDTEGDSVTSGTFTGRINIPSIPTGLKVVPKDKEVILSWNANPETFVAQYRIYVNNEVNMVVNSPSTSTKVTGLINEVNYSFQIEAVADNTYSSEISDEVFAITHLDIPNTPKITTHNEIGNGGVELFFEHIQKEYHSHYRIYKEGFLYADNVKTLSFQTDYFEANKTHSFQVQAVDIQGDRSPMSESYYVTVYSKIQEPLSVELGKISENVKVVKPQLYLCKPNKQTIGKLAEAYSINYHTRYADLNEITFNVPYNVENNFILDKNRNYDNTKERFLIRLELGRTIEYFIINEITNNFENNGKTIHAWSLGYELKDKLINNFKEEFYTAHSAMLYALDSVLNWKIGANIKNSDFYWNQETRIFAVSNTTVLDFIVSVAKSFNAVLVWDTVNRIVDFANPTALEENRGLKIKYGKYLKSISKSSTVEEMVTQLRPIGENNLSIRDASVNGSEVLEDFTFFINGYEEDELGNVISHSPYMSDELCRAIKNYNELLASREGEFQIHLENKKLRNEELVELEYTLVEKETDLFITQDLLNTLKLEGTLFYHDTTYNGIKQEITFSLKKDYKYQLIGLAKLNVGANIPTEMLPDITTDAQGRNLFHGVPIGGYFSGAFELNKNQLGETQDGEIRINLEFGDKIYHTNGNVYPITSGKYIPTHFEGTDPRSTGKAYIMYVGSDFSRFGDVGVDAHEFSVEEASSLTTDRLSYYPAYSDLDPPKEVSRDFIYAFYIDGVWKYGNNSYLLQEFTPNANDIIVAEFTRNSTASAGIESLTLYSENFIVITNHGVHNYVTDDWSFLEKISFDRTGETTVESSIDEYEYKLTILGTTPTEFEFQINRILVEEFETADNEDELLNKYSEELHQRDYDTQLALVDDKKTEIQIIETDIETLQSELSIYNNFPIELQEERDLFVIEKEYVDEKINNPYDLKKRASEKFEELKNPIVTITIDIVNLLEILEEHYNWHKLEIGTIINVFYEKFGISITAKIIEMIYDFDNKIIQLTISNVKDIRTNQQKFIEALYGAISTSTTVSIEKNGWAKGTEVATEFESFINKEFDATKQKIIAGTNETVEISRRGILIKSDVDPNNFLVANASVLAITNDGGKSYKNAITTDGIIGERIVGKILAGENLLIENQAGTFKVDKDGVTISNQALKITGGITQDQFADDVNFTGELSGIAKDYIDTFKNNINVPDIPYQPTLSTTVGTVVQHVDVTADLVHLSYDWTFNDDGTPRSDIDGFMIYLYSSSSSAMYVFGSNPKQEISFYVKPDKRSIILYNVPKNLYYTFGIEAYRVVDKAINPTGVIKSALTQVGGVYRPSSFVPYDGDILGTINYGKEVKVKPEILTALRLGQSYNNVTIDTVNGLQMVDSNNTQRVFLNSGGFKIQTNDGTGFVDKLYATSTGLVAEDLTANRLIVNDGTGQVLINAKTKTINFDNFDIFTGYIHGNNIDAKNLQVIHSVSGLPTFTVSNEGDVSVEGNIVMKTGSITWGTGGVTAPTYTQIGGTKPPTDANNTYSQLLNNTLIRGFYYNNTTGRLEILADNITAGNINATLITTGQLNADLITVGTMSGERIDVGTLNGDRIITGTLSFDKAQGGSLTLGGVPTGEVDENNEALYTNGSFILKNSKGEEVARLDGDYGGFGTLRISELQDSYNVIFKTHGKSPNIDEATGDIFYYVDPVNGTEDGLGTQADPVQRIQTVIDRLPKYLDRDVFIYFVPNLLLDTAINIYGFVGSGSIILSVWKLPIRYVREHMAGNTVNQSNHWVEFETWNLTGTKLSVALDNISTSRINQESLVPIENRVYDNGIVKGGIFTGRFVINTQYDGVANVGEIKIDTTEGNTFYHPNGNKYTVATGNLEISTSLEGSTATTYGYVAFIGTDKTRFVYPFPQDHQDFMVVMNDNGVWKYNNNTTWVAFTPNANDCLIATVGKSSATATGIDVFEEIVDDERAFKSLKRIVDGNRDTNSYFDGGQLTTYIDLYLGGVYTDLHRFNSLHYFNDSRKYKDVKIEVSQDKVKWYTLFDSKRDGEYTETSAGKNHYINKGRLKGYIKCFQNGISVQIKDLFIDASGMNAPAVIAQNGGEVIIRDCIITGDKNYSYAVYAYGGNIRLLYSEVNYAQLGGVMSAYGGHMEVYSCKGAGYPHGHMAHSSGTLGGGGTGLLGDTSNTQLSSGGFISGSWSHTRGEFSPQPVAPPPPTTQIVTRTKTWTSTHGDAWNEASGGWHTAEDDVLQGRYSSSLGLYRGLWFFPTDMRNTCVNARSITNVQIYVTRANTSGNSGGVTHTLKAHGYASKPSSIPGFHAPSQNFTASRGQSQWINITGTFASLFKNGSVYGMGLYTGNTSSSYYSRCSPVAKIEITYTEEITV